MTDDDAAPEPAADGRRRWPWRRWPWRRWPWRRSRAPLVLTGAILDRAMYQAVAVGGLLALLLSVDAASSAPASPRIPLLTPVGLLAEGACVAWCAVSSRRSVLSKRAVRALVLVSALLLVLLPVAYPPEALDSDRPPLMHVVVFALVATPFAFRPAASILTGIAAAAVAYTLREPVMGRQAAAIDATLLALTAWTFAAATHLLRRAAGEVDLVEDALWRAREETGRATRRAHERERWNALVHDKVLGALTLAARGVSAPAREAASDLARQALLEISGRDRPDSSLEAAIRRRADLLGVRLTLDVEGDGTDPLVAAALQDAATEALTNVARHSRTRSATVTGRLAEHSASLVISDRGVGFDVGAATSRAGIRLGMKRRIDSVGGTATVSSAPGRGTTVTLHWQAPNAGAPASASWDTRTFLPLLAIGIVLLLGHAAMGLYQLDGTRSPVLALVLGGVLITNSVLLAAAVPARSRRFLALCVLAALIPGALTVNLQDPATFDWRYWFVGAHTLVIGAVALRRSARAGGALAGGILVSITMAQLARSGHLAPSVPFSVAPQLLGTAAVAGFCRVALDRSAATTRRATADASAARLERAAQEIKAAEQAERTQAMGRATMRHLARIASGGPFSPAEAQAFLRAEASVRDQLTAHGLSAGAVASAAERARDRGVLVELLADTPVEGPGGRAFVESCVAALRRSPSGARVRAVWRPAGAGRLGTVAVTGAGSGAAAGDDALGLSSATRAYATVTVDEDAVLVEVREPAQQAALTAVCRPLGSAHGTAPPPASSTEAAARRD